MSKISQLAEAMQQTGNSRSRTVRQLLKLINRDRRGIKVNKQLALTLRRNGLYTDPDFQTVHIDDKVRVKLRDQDVIKAKRATKNDQQAAIGQLHSVKPEESSEEDRPNDAANEARLTIDQLVRKRTPLFVKRTEDIVRAISKMRVENASVLIVSQNERLIDGIITWELLVKANHKIQPGVTVQEVMDPHPEIRNHNSDLLETANIVTQKGFVLVKGRDNKISHIVSAADLAEQFVSLAEPFLSLEEIENHLRTFIKRAKMKLEDLIDLVHSEDPKRLKAIKSADDLTLGEIIRAFEQPTIYEKTKIPLARDVFVKVLKKVGIIRNQVMHFHPDGISPEDRQSLENARQMLQDL
jgi:hypothetical protein